MYIVHYKLNLAMFGSKPWEKPTAFGAKMEYCLVTLAFRKTNSCKQHSLLVHWSMLVT